MIPEGWSTERLGDICEIVMGQSPESRHYNRTGNGLPLIQGNADIANRRTIQRVWTTSAPKRAEAGDVLLTVRAPVGAVGRASAEVCLGRGVCAVKSNEVVSDFLFHALVAGEPRWSALEQGSTFTAANGRDVADFTVCIPEQHSEQQAIAEALSDADALVESFDALIAKKRDMKQAAMQHLFSKSLMPNNENSLIRFGHDVSMKARIGWQGLTTAEYLVRGAFRLVTGTDIRGGAINWDTCWYVDKSRYDQDKNIQLRKDDVLVTKDGTIGKVGFIDSLPCPATLNSGVFVLRPVSDRIQARYLRHLMFSRVFGEFLDRLTAGSTITHLYQKDFETFTVVVPGVEEQIAIAEVLSDMDAETNALVAQREKAELVKQGMMQELLSGRVRLV